MTDLRDDGHGYNPNRDKNGRFGSGSHSKPAAKPKRAPAPKFNAVPHQKRIARHKADELKHRQASLKIKAQMAELKKTARATTPKQRAALKERFGKLAARRDAYKAKATEAKAARVEAGKAMQTARMEYRRKQPAARTAGPAMPTSVAASQSEAAGASKIAGAAASGRLAVARRHIDDIMKSNGLARSADWTRRGVKIEHLDGAFGMHHWDGSISLAPGTARDARRFGEAVKRGDHVGMRDFGDGMSTVFHESLHNYGPVRKDDYWGRHARVEEVATEVTARRMMREHYGIHQADGAYQREIDGTLAVIRQHKGVDHATAHAELERAALEYKRTPPGHEDPSTVFARHLGAGSMTTGKIIDTIDSQIGRENLADIKGEIVRYDSVPQSVYQLARNDVAGCLDMVHARGQIGSDETRVMLQLQDSPEELLAALQDLHGVQ